MELKNSLVDDATRKAYLTTKYHVFADAPFILQIGLRSQELLALYSKHRVSSALFITACNPYSQVVSNSDNLAKQRELKNFLMLSELIFFKGLGKPACGNWGAEDSFLVLGMDQAASMKLGRHFEQNAIVFSEYDAIPKLLLLR